jgi:hypothetical protein
MKKSIFVILTICLFSTTYAQVNPLLHNDRIIIRNDTGLFITIKKIILNDLNKNDIELIDLNTYHIGISFELKALFKNQRIINMVYHRRPYRIGSKNEKYKYYWQFLFWYKKDPKWVYQFIGLNSDKKSGIYANYAFSFQSEDIQIINKTIEILENDQAIIDKIYSRW